MNVSSDSNAWQPFRVGDWQVNPDSGRLSRDGTEVKLEPRVMAVLIHLAQHPGEVISRETLETEVWAGAVVGYEAVSQSIIKLRKAMQDDSRHPHYIETISKKGYRLIAPVSQDPDAAGQKQAFPSIGKSRQLLFVGAVVLSIIGITWFMVGPDSTTSTTPSVVVLPFKNLSDDPRQEYFSDGITDDLTTDLSRLDSIRVVARQSAYYFKQNPAPLADIARQLGVMYIVEGSVRKSGNRIRVNVQLTNTRTGETVWGKRFDTDANDIFRVQDEIAGTVMNAMYVTLSRRHVDTRGTRSFEAYDAFLLGQQYIKSRSRQGYEQAMNAYRRAIQLDPDYARAYGAMAVTVTRGYRYQWSDLSPVEARERALELAKKAVELNQSTPQIYWSLGYVYLHRREFDAAEAAARKSIALSSNYADGYALLANIANWRGRPEDAVRYIKQATRLNPYHTFQYSSTLGEAYYNLGQYGKAVTALQDALERNENALNPRLYLAAAYVKLERSEEAEWEVKQILINRPEVTRSGLSTVLPYENKQYVELLQKDLRKAGLP